MDMKILLLLIFIFALTTKLSHPARKQKRQEVVITEKEGLVRMIETYYAASPDEDIEKVDMIITTPDDAAYNSFRTMAFITLYRTWIFLFMFVIYFTIDVLIFVRLMELDPWLPFLML